MALKKNNQGIVGFVIALFFVSATYPFIKSGELPFYKTTPNFHEDWGFFGHKRINRMAVFTLPPEMMVLYKKHIEYLTDHAVDPDKRRYATKHEAVRHYIDIDHWGKPPYDNIPRNWTSTLMKFTDVFIVQNEDTIPVFGEKVVNIDSKQIEVIGKDFLKPFNKVNHLIPTSEYRTFFSKNLLDQYYEEDWIISVDSISRFFKNQGLEIQCSAAFAKDRFSEYGILPYHLIKMQQKLTNAFEQGNSNAILRLSADFGHYIGDAHVPLHTTENYNGQFTNQIGIHAFWESRIPELFADQYFDYFVGKATYIEKPQTYYWDIVLTSHAYLDSVLLIEKRLSHTFPQDKQYCYDDRLERTQRTQCKAYAAEYNRLMKGMVESRMRNSIQAIGNAWYTAWIDAGQPDLSKLGTLALSEEEKKQQQKEDALFKAGEIKGREH